jgi:hypothetical protein
MRDAARIGGIRLGPAEITSGPLEKIVGPAFASSAEGLRPRTTDEERLYAARR